MNTANGSQRAHRVQDMGIRPPQIGGVPSKPKELKLLDPNTQLRPKLILLNKPPIPMLTLRRLGFTTSRRRIITTLVSSITTVISTIPRTRHYQEMEVRLNIPMEVLKLMVVRPLVLSKDIGNNPTAHCLNLLNVLRFSRGRLPGLCHRQC